MLFMARMLKGKHSQNCFTLCVSFMLLYKKDEIMALKVGI